MSQAVSH